MKNKEFVLTLVCYDRKFSLWKMLKSRIEEAARFIAEDLTFEFNYCDAFYSQQIRCFCHPKEIIDNGWIIFKFSVETNCKNDDIVPLLIDTLYEVAYEYIGEYNIEVEIK